MNERLSHRATGEGGRVAGSKDDSLTKEQFEQLLNATSTLEERLIILLSGEVGLRADELAHVSRSWLRPQAGQLVIPANENGWRPKTAAGARTIPVRRLSPRTWEALTTYLGAHELLGIHRSTVHRTVKRVASRTNLLRNVYPHSLRATAATRLAYHIRSPYTLMAIFGWSNVSTALHYIRRAGGATEDAIRRDLEGVEW